ncbi:MAG: transposase [Mariniphaga sp.]|nr:transposase [Mariniphaga sp.]
MFRKSALHTQGNLFSSVPSILGGKSLNQYNDNSGWHNQFRKQIVSRIDESIFSVLFSQKMGAPNSPVSQLVGMMILKEAFGWSDSQLFEHCRFNLLVRSALGLFNLDDEVPADSTYYLFRKRVHQYMREKNEDLLQKVFEKVTRGQVKDFEVSGKSIRMDSKLFSSNIAWYSRYEIIHQTFVLFCKTLNESDFLLFSEAEKQQLKLLLEEEPQKTIYHSTREDIQTRMQTTGILIYKTLLLFSGNNSEAYQLLRRVFREQYKVEEKDKKIELRPKEEIESDSVQSPHDPDSAYRHKSDQKVKGYSMNVTETISDGPLDLITNVNVDKANVADTIFVQPAISSTQAITDTPVEKVYADGAYQSPGNDEFCKNIDMVFTGIQGAASRYDLEMTSEGLMVTDTKTGERLKATLAKKLKNSTEDRWYIRNGKDKVYFNQKAIRTSLLRRVMKQRPIEESQKRNNVEATIFHVAYPLRSGKSKYRSLIKNQTWAICRCFWVNLVRIIHFIEQTCQRTFQKSKSTAFTVKLWLETTLYGSIHKNLAWQSSVFAFVIFYNTFNQFFKTYLLE